MKAKIVKHEAREVWDRPGVVSSMHRYTFQLETGDTDYFDIPEAKHTPAEVEKELRKAAIELVARLKKEIVI